MAPSQEPKSNTRSDSIEETHTNKLPETRYTEKRWTLGNSQELVEGQEKEPLLVTAAWIVIPIAITLSILLLMGR